MHAIPESHALREVSKSSSILLQWQIAELMHSSLFTLTLKVFLYFLRQYDAGNVYHNVHDC